MQIDKDDEIFYLDFARALSGYRHVYTIHEDRGTSAQSYKKFYKSKIKRSLGSLSNTPGNK